MTFAAPCAGPVPLASVVVPTHAGALRLPVLLTALATQDYPEIEIVVVIDGDVDGSELVVRRHLGELGRPAQVVVLPENQGRAAALTAGFAAARGEVLIRCDDDLELGPGFVGGHVARHTEAAEAIGVVGLCRNTFPDTPYARAYGAPTDHAARATAYLAPADSTWRFWGGNVSVTRATYDRIGPYDGEFRAYGWEDVDWGYRLHQAGVPIVIARELEVVHHLAAVTTALRAGRAYHSGAARAHFQAKHPAARIAGGPLPSATWRTTAWHLLVSLAAPVCRPPHLERVGRVADGVARWVPRPVGRKVVAAVVEGAAQAGASGR